VVPSDSHKSSERSEEMDPQDVFLSCKFFGGMNAQFGIVSIVFSRWEIGRGFVLHCSDGLSSSTVEMIREIHITEKNNETNQTYLVCKFA